MWETASLAVAVWLTTTLIFIIDPDWKIESKQHMSHIYSFWSIWCCILSDELLTALDWMFRFIWLGEEMGLNWWIGFTSHVKVHVVKGCLAKIINRQNCAKSNKFSFNLPLFCSCELSTLNLCKRKFLRFANKWSDTITDQIMICVGGIGKVCKIYCLPNLRIFKNFSNKI